MILIFTKHVVNKLFRESITLVYITVREGARMQFVMDSFPSGSRSLLLCFCLNFRRLFLLMAGSMSGRVFYFSRLPRPDDLIDIFLHEGLYPISVRRTSATKYLQKPTVYN